MAPIPTAVLTLGEKIDADAVLTGRFLIPARETRQVVAHLGAELLLLYAPDDLRAEAIGLARLKGIEAAPAGSKGRQINLILDQYQPFVQRVTAMPRQATKQRLAPLDPAAWAELQQTLVAGLSEPAAPFEAAHVGREQSTPARCVMTGEELPGSSHGTNQDILLIVPALFGGHPTPGNILPAHPNIARAWAAGAMTVNDLGEIISNNQRVGDGLRHRLLGNMLAVDPADAPDPRALRFHRERVFDGGIAD